MIKVGVWLTSEPYTGGTFQYTLSVLRAFLRLKELSPSKYDFICLSRNLKWESFLQDEGLPFRFHHVVEGFFQKRLKKFLSITDGGLSFWKRINHMRIFSCAQIYNSDLNAIVFTANDMFAYETDIPVIATIHDLMHRYESRFPEVGNVREYENRETYYTRICKFAKAIIVDSETGRDHVVESYGDLLNANIIPLPYVPPPYVFDSHKIKDYSYVRAKYDLPERYIFYPAQFWVHKNHENLLLAMELLKKGGTTVSAVFAGSPKNNFDSIVAMIGDLDLTDHIRIVGYLPNEDMIGLYKNSLSLVMPTFFGPTNIPVLEAMYLRVPVLCSNIYAMPVQVGDAGLLFDPESPQDISEKIYKVWTDEKLREILIEKGARKAEEMTIDNFALRWAKIIKHIVTLKNL